MPPQKLYAIQNTATGHVKIGIAANPEKRRASLQAGATGRLKVLLEIEAKSAVTSEAYLHRQFDSDKLYGEWFNINDLSVLETAFCEASELEPVDKPLLPDMGVRWKLREFLDAHNITPHQLAVKTDGKLSQRSVYSLANSRTNGVRFDTLEAIIPVLKELTGKPVQLTDLLDYSDEPN